MAYDNVLLDAVLWSLVVGGFAVWAIRKERRHAERQQQVSDPVSHVTVLGVDLSDRPTPKVGVDHHSKLCWDGHRLTCMCGKADRDAAGEVSA